MRILAMLLSLVATPSLAQDDSSAELLELRITAVYGESLAVIDRGSLQGLAVGDEILFRPRGGGVYRGVVTAIEERTAQVELRERFAAEPGVRGEANIPAGRLADTEANDDPAQPGPARPTYQDRDDGWTPEMPLLARVKAVRPKDRARSMSGRIYFTTDHIFATDSDQSDSYFRLGTELTYENAFTQEGRLHLDGEFNYERLELPDENDDGGSQARIDRLSFAWGGHRFANEGFEVGRFLHRVVPEFGVLDGLQWTKRLDNGDRLGVSFGYLPEPDPDQDTGEDLQFASYYQWVSDLSEQLQVTGGFQKTLHNGTSDRDLLLTKVHYSPAGSPWSGFGSAWVDFYDSRDDLKNSGAELTQAIASLSHRWESGDDVELSYRRSLFPEMERSEFLWVEERELRNGRHDRLAIDGRYGLNPKLRIHGGTGIWDDEEESGADMELGLETRDFVLNSDLFDCTLYGQLGEFSSVFGARFLLSNYENARSWSLFYEIAKHHMLGYPDDSDDIFQHRLRAGRDFGLVRGWHVTGYFESVLWDDEIGLMLGAYVQKELRQ